MCTFLGTAGKINEDDVSSNAIKNSEIIFLEGYLWDEGDPKKAFNKAINNANKVAMSLSDLFCVDRHKPHFLFQDGDKTLEVLKDVNLDLDKGSILTIKGASGSGKSTLLSLLGTLDQPDSGEIVIDNNNLKTINNYDSIRNKHIGFVFQFHNLIAELNIVENVTIPSLIAGKNNDSDYLNKLFEYFDLSNRKKSFPLDLSGGEKQRVSVMRAIINKPSIIIADEPTGNLDEQNAIKMIDLFQKLNNDFNLTFVIATHDEKVFSIGDKKMNLYDGTLLEL